MSEKNSPRFWDLQAVVILLVVILMMALFVSESVYHLTVARLRADFWAEDDDLNELIIAMTSGQPAARVEDLSARVDINARDHLDYTPLMDAVRAGRLDICRRLMDRGADVNASTHTGLTPLMVAVLTGDESAVRLLLSRGAAVDGPTCSGRTALMVACYVGNDELAAVLLEAGSNVNARSRQGVTPLIDAAASTPPTPRTLRLIRRLSDAGAAINTADNDGATALMEAAKSNSGPVIALLVSLGADMRTRDRLGRDAVAIAREGRCDAALAALLAEAPSTPAK
jgi:ankyrin repeat protein